MKPVVHISAANREIAKAAVRYDRQVLGLGDRFFEVLEETERKIQKNPEAGAPHFFNTRKWLVHDFPYLIIYRVLSDRIVVYAVAHTSRRPGYWGRRLD